ncbi:MAG: hypothetical protein ACXVPQ_09560 [Bacteroidia bacterium]
MSTIQVNIPETNPKSEWLTEGDKRFLKYAAFTGGTLIVLTIAGAIIKHKLKIRKAGNAENLAMVDGTAQSYAKRFQMALDHWFHADTQQVRQVFQDIPYQDLYKAIETEYDNLTKKKVGALGRDLTEKLYGTEYNEMQAILNSKPVKKGQKAVFDWPTAHAYAHRIRAAFDNTTLGFSTPDITALQSALRDIPTLYAYAMVRVAYKMDYKVELEDDLNSRLIIYDFSWKHIVYNKPVK